MSIKVIIHIMEEMHLPRPWAAILMAMGDHADDEGRHCYPSVDKIAWKANYKPRQVINIMRDMEREGIITRVRGATQHRPAEYQINLDNAPRKLPFEEWRGRNGRGANSQPAGVQSGDLGVQSGDSGMQSGDSGVQPIAPEPSNESPNEPSNNPPMVEGTDASQLAMTERAEEVGTSERPTLAERFERWYAHYPKKKGKADARRSWNRIKPNETLTDQMIAAVTVHLATDQWRKDGGQYIPYPARWLNAGMWEDEVESPAGTTPSGDGVREAFRAPDKPLSVTELLRATHLPATDGQRARMKAGESAKDVLTPEQYDLAQQEARRQDSARKMFNVAGTVF